MQSKEANKLTYSCSYEKCSSTFSRPGRLKAHLLGHENQRPFKCPENSCAHAYTSKSHLVRHLNQAHSGSNTDFIFSCPHCLKTYANRQNLKRHIKVYHILKVPFSCDICKLEFRKKHQLNTHMYEHTGVKAFRCEECSEEFTSLYYKKRHMRFHKTYPCPECNIEFNHWSKFQKHLKTEHMFSKEFVCDHCKKIFKKRPHIVRHMKLHYETTRKTFVCSYKNCIREYSKKGNLKQHVLIKHEKKLFNCINCKSKLTTMANLKQHMQRHYVPKETVKPKTKVTGRRERFDKDTLKVSTALKLSGLLI